IAATNRDLPMMIERGEFRRDLFYRLNVLVIPVPPLRERRDDIPALCEHFLAKYCAENRLSPKKLGPDALALFMGHPWPGNVRELENTIERAVVMCDGDTVTARHLPPGFSAAPAALHASGNGGDVHITAPLEEMVNDFERRIILKALEDNDWRQNRAADALGVTERSIWYKIKKLGIGVTDDEIRYFLQNTPPAEIQQYFLDKNGNFDFQAYQTALNNPEIDWSNLENLARERIPLQKLQTYLQNMVHVSTAEVRRAYEEQNTRLSAAYVEFPSRASDIGDYVPAPADVQSYYNEHKDAYSEPEKARLEIAAIDIRPTARDIESTRYKLDLVREQLLAGEDFSALAKSYSEAPTAASGGETGFIKAGQRDQAYVDALRTLEPGAISPLIKTNTGFYLVKLVEKKSSPEGGEEFSGLEIFMKISPGFETADSLQSVAARILTKAQEAGLASAAAESNIPLATPKPFMKNYPIDGIGFAPKLSDFAFSSKAGTLSAVLRDETHFFVARLAERIPASVKPLEEVKDAVSRELAENKKREIAREKALSFYREAKGGDFNSVAAKYGMEARQLADFHVSDNLETFGTNSIVATAAFSVNDITPPVESRGSYFVLKLLSRQPFDADDYQKKMASIGARLYQDKVQKYVAYWYEQMEKKSKVEDFRQQL
ncbi:MAG: peptidyl-prolyl cis-trans isomerase, partial [Chitinivibrionia bacterium]|nr:peptidyl-prolyl cis-trans isomerase [Chitinivibrionia bacterium]